MRADRSSGCRLGVLPAHRALLGGALKAGFNT